MNCRGEHANTLRNLNRIDLIHDRILSDQTAKEAPGSKRPKQTGMSPDLEREKRDDMGEGGRLRYSSRKRGCRRGSELPLIMVAAVARRDPERRSCTRCCDLPPRRLGTLADCWISRSGSQWKTLLQSRIGGGAPARGGRRGREGLLARWVDARVEWGRTDQNPHWPFFRRAEPLQPMG